LAASNLDSGDGRSDALPEDRLTDSRSDDEQAPKRIGARRSCPKPSLTIQANLGIQVDVALVLVHGNLVG